MKKLVILLTAFFLVLLLLEPANAEDRLFFNISGDVLAVYGNDDKIFDILTVNNNNYYITTIYENYQSTTINTDIQYNSASYSYLNGSFCFFENAYPTNDAQFFCLNITTFDRGEAVPHRAVINYAHIGRDCGAYSDGRYYAAENSSLSVYSSRKQLETMIDLETPCRKLVPFDNGVYCICYGRVVEVTGGNVTRVIGIDCDDIKVINDNLICGDTIYDYWWNEVESGIDGRCGAAFACDALVCAKDGRLTAIKNVKEIILGDALDNTIISGTGSRFAFFTPNGNGIEAVFYDDINENIPVIETKIVVDPGQTAYRLANEWYKGAEFTKNGVRFSGKLATGVVMHWEGNDYDIIVPGDVSGDGNINLTDVRIAEKVLFKKTTLSGVYFTAGDIDENGIFDLCDAYLIYVRRAKR